jgi:hypothetical protein
MRGPFPMRFMEGRALRAFVPRRSKGIEILVRRRRPPPSMVALHRSFLTFFHLQGDQIGGASSRAFVPRRSKGIEIFVRRRRAPPSIFVRVARHFFSGFSVSREVTQMMLNQLCFQRFRKNLPENVDTRMRLRVKASFLRSLAPNQTTITYRQF